MPEVSVVISSLNGAEGLDVCLRSLARQTIADELEVILVDDGSTDGTAEVGRAHGARVVRHEVNHGLSAARNSGILVARAPIVAFTDDDCEPEADWAEHLLAAHGPGVIGVGGDVIPEAAGFIGRYLRRHNPLGSREIEVTEPASALTRLRRYFSHLWSVGHRDQVRPVHSLCGANMSFRREALLQAGMFDPRFTRAADDLEVCCRIRDVMPAARFVLQPRARVVHHFKPSLRDTVRRARTYGLSDALMRRKWPSTPFVLFFFPLVLMALLSVAARRRTMLPLALVSPLAMFPTAIRDAVSDGTPECLADPFLQLAQESAWNVGFLHGLWRFRQLPAESSPLPRAASADPATYTGAS